MAGIYIHIPFCKKACHYCNFHFSTSTNLLEDLVQAILKEIELQNDFFSTKVQTIYFGGGTPSLLKSIEIEKILNKIQTHYTLEDNIEITLEANPDDIQPNNLKDWRQIGINRLSIGVQSFFDDDLIWMNRAHSAQQSLQCIDWAYQHQLSNINIDLIYGIPNMSAEKWMQNLEKVSALNIKHLSAYALTVEPKTALAKFIQQGRVQDVDTETQLQHFDILDAWAKANNFEFYEISNLAKPGWRSNHNSNYWQNQPYLGIGPSAHSFKENIRQWNIAHNVLYIKSISEGIVPYEQEVLTPAQQINEYLLTNLRRMEGVNLSVIKNALSAIQYESWMKKVTNYINKNKLFNQSNALCLTHEGKKIADAITVDLFIEV